MPEASQVSTQTFLMSKQSVQMRQRCDVLTPRYEQTKYVKDMMVQVIARDDPVGREQPKTSSTNQFRPLVARLVFPALRVGDGRHEPQNAGHLCGIKVVPHDPERCVGLPGILLRPPHGCSPG